MNYLNKVIGKVLTITIVFILIFISCDKENSPSPSEVDEFKEYRKKQLINLYDNEIAKLNTNFILETGFFNDAIAEFNQQTNLENLEIVQQRWVDVSLVWGQMELYKIGTVPDNYIFYKINYWPPKLTFINNFINGSDIINENYIESKGASSKGIFAIEYLLFNTDNQMTFESFTMDTNFDRRLAYLVGLSENLKNKAIELEMRWVDYKPAFLSALDKGLDGGQDLIVNAMVAQLEKIKISKLEKPLGTNNSNILNFTKLEAYRSGKSLEIIKENLISLERCFNGEFNDSSEINTGFDDYLIALDNEDLAIKIADDFTNCFNKLELINSPLREDLFNNTQNVNELKNAVKKLLLDIKVEMAHAINTIITFSENDGD